MQQKVILLDRVNMKPIFLCCLFFLGIAGCNSQKNGIEISTVNTFPVNDSLKMSSLNLTNELNFPTRIYCYDSILALLDNRNDKQIILLSATDRTTKK